MAKTSLLSYSLLPRLGYLNNSEPLTVVTRRQKNDRMNTNEAKDSKGGDRDILEGTCLVIAWRD